MSDKTATVNGRKATLFRDGKNPVYVLDDGRFAAAWGSRWIVKATLRAIDKVLDTVRKTVSLLCTRSPDGYANCTPKVLEVTEFATTRLIDKDGKILLLSEGDWYLNDSPDRVAQLTALAARVAADRDAWLEEYLRIMNGARRITRHDFADALAGTLDPPDPDRDQ